MYILLHSDKISTKDELFTLAFLLSRRTVIWRVKLVTLLVRRNTARRPRRRLESTTSMNPANWREATFSRGMPRFV